MAQIANIKKRLSWIPGGELGTEATIAKMRQFAVQSSVDPTIINLARQIVADAAELDFAAKAEAIRAWVAQNIKYENETYAVETLIHPVTLIAKMKVRSGDCDCQATLVASLLLAVGIPARFAVMGAYNNRTHVWTEAEVDGVWYAVDTTNRHQTSLVVNNTPGKRTFDINNETIDGILSKMDNGDRTGHLASLSLSGDPLWLQVLQRVATVQSGITTMIQDGKLRQADVDNAFLAITNTLPKESGEMNPQSVRNIPGICRLYKMANATLTFFASPVTKIILLGGVVAVAVVLVQKNQRKHIYKGA